MISREEIALRIVFAALVGGLIGLERERNRRPAGLRTHILVTVGSALIMLISAYGFESLGRVGDPARTAAQVVSGIGFLGAGTIFKSGSGIKGLTTAASLWVCGGIGLAVGVGFYFAAGFVALVSIASLSLLNMLEHSVLMGARNQLIINCMSRPGLLSDIERVLTRHQISMVHIEMSTEEPENEILVAYGYPMELCLEISSKKEMDVHRIGESLMNIQGVHNLRWERGE